jgi:hypothetical protein
MWYVVVCDLETSSRMRRPWPALGCSAIGKKTLWSDYILAVYILICSPLKYRLLETYMSFQANEDWCFDETAYFFLYVTVTYGPFARHI